MESTLNRAYSNIAMLKFVIEKLGKLVDEFVFLGGCATALLITDPAVPDVRATLDVDCVVDVLSLHEYHNLEKLLYGRGFKKSLHDDVICRWNYEGVILDVMPSDSSILGFGNRWYKSAISNSSYFEITKNQSIRLVSAPYFLATKFEAFKTRGNNDYLMSHDFEDIITVIDGRPELIEEFLLVEDAVKHYLQMQLSDVLADSNFISYLPGLLN